MPLPFGPPIEPMLAKLDPKIPDGQQWLYEPKWDGFRAIVYFDGAEAYLQSRDLKPLARYFPELQEGLQAELPRPMVLDGEVVIMGEDGIDFEALQLRLHPAASRVRMLAEKTPSSFVAFDMLADGDEDLRKTPFAERRRRLEAAFKGPDSKKRGIGPPVHITPMTTSAETAQDWFNRFEGAGFDGVIAKKGDSVYKPGVREMLKIKHLRTVDVVVGGFRWYKDMEGKAVGSLLLGLYGDDGTFHFVGHTSSFDAKAKQALVPKLQPYITENENEGFGQGRTPGGPSRWNTGKDVSWIRLRPELVIEVTFDYLQGERFRHAATFKRWRTDKPPEACTFDQLEATVPYELAAVFAEG